MKVRIDYTIEATDVYRRAINHHYGRTGMATLPEVQSFVEDYGRSVDDDIQAELLAHWDSKRGDAAAVDDLTRGLDLGKAKLDE